MVCTIFSSQAHVRRLLLSFVRAFVDYSSTTVLYSSLAGVVGQGAKPVLREQISTLMGRYNGVQRAVTGDLFLAYFSTLFKVHCHDLVP